MENNSMWRDIDWFEIFIVVLFVAFCALGVLVAAATSQKTIDSYCKIVPTGVFK